MNTLLKLKDEKSPGFDERVAPSNVEAGPG
jgi:hypothetical protein